MTEATRQRWRRRLLWLGLLPLLVALAFTGKVTSMLLLEWQGHSSYDGGEFGDARESFAANLTLNVLESWVAPYDEGTARYRLGDASGAVRSLEDALDQAPEEEQCRVRINLALAQEAVGDAALAGGRADVARSAWTTALATLAEGFCLVVAGDDQRARSADPAAAAVDQAGAARVVDARLREKLATPEDQATPTPPSSTRDEQLERRNERGQEQRDRREQQQDQEPPSPSDSGEEEPPTYYW
jgi:tetratricopeptide (TPR) repeat protein